MEQVDGKTQNKLNLNLQRNLVREESKENIARVTCP